MRDCAWSAVFAVCEIVWNVEFILRTLRHELNALRPTFDYLVETEYCRLSALVRAVELNTVEERTGIVALDL